LINLTNPAVGTYLKEHPKLADDFTVEFMAHLLINLFRS